MPTALESRGSTVIPGLLYRDAPAMIEWLCRVFGFEKKAVHEDGQGGIAHAELVLGAGMLMIGSAPRPGETTLWATLVRQPDELNLVETQSPSLTVADADAVYERVKANGGEVVLEIEDKDYGGRGFACRDPEGHLWSVSTYDPWAA